MTEEVFQQNIVKFNPEKGSLDIELNLEQLRGCKLFVATPMYGGVCHGVYTRSMMDLAAVMKANGIELRYYSIFNESLITRARAYCCDEFMRSDCSHMIFLDSDIGFNPSDILVMLALQSLPDNPYDVLSAPYPKKTISWEKIVLAVNKGVADNNPGELEKFVGDYVFNPAPGVKEFRIVDLVEVMEAGTGFMMIKRETFEKFNKAYPEKSYKPDHVRTKNFDGSREIMMYFDTVIDPETKRYLSEDYMFCQYVRNMGSKVWMCPWMQTVHVGSYMFGGSLAALASIGASPTADPDSLKNMKK